MPNFHDDHTGYAGDKCKLGSPMVLVCRYSIVLWLAFAATVGLIIGAVLTKLNQ